MNGMAKYILEAEWAYFPTTEDAISDHRHAHILTVSGTLVAELTVSTSNPKEAAEQLNAFMGQVVALHNHQLGQGVPVPVTEHPVQKEDV